MPGFTSNTLRRAREERLPQAAGSLTFTTLLSVVPLLAVSFAFFTRFAPFRAAGLAIRQHLLQGVLPPDLARTVLRHLAQFTANTGGLTWVGALFVAGSAFVMLLSVENVLNRIWQVKKQRPLHKRLGLYVVMLALGPPLVGASLWATSYVLTVSAGLIATPGSHARLALQLVPVLLGTLGLACLFRFVPNANVRFRDALVGGLLGAIAFELGKRGFALYLAQVPTYRTVYGAFAPVLLFLVWVYFSWLVALAAALVTASLGRGGRAAPQRRVARA
jgi:membrane protein